MIIDNEWVKNYIKTHGQKIVIPKEATIIKAKAFTYDNIPEHEDEQFIIEFEDDSHLEIIENGAFSIEVANTIILPKSLKKIEEFAFWGYPISVKLPQDSEIEVCDSSYVFMGLKNIEVPANVESLVLLSDLVEHAETIRIPPVSKLKFYLV